MTCRCRSGECDPECDGPMLRAEIERLQADKDVQRSQDRNAAYEAEIERLRAEDVQHRIRWEELKDARAEIERLRAELDLERRRLATSEDLRTGLARSLEQKVSDPDEGLPTAKDVRGILKPAGKNER